MKKTIGFSLLIAISGGALAQEAARVITSTPIVVQIAVPHKVCTNQQVTVQDPKSGAGGLAGLAIGGAIGNRFGSGDGRAVATLIGAVGGALIGDRLDKQPSTSRVENVQSCQVQNILENRTTGYNVVYEYAGRQYSTQTATDPGSTLSIQVTPVALPPVTVTPIAQAPVGYYQPIVTTAPVYRSYVYPTPSQQWHKGWYRDHH